MSTTKPHHRALLRGGTPLVLMVILAAACGTKSDSVSATLAPGQSTLVDLHVSDVEGNTIVSCESATINNGDGRTQLALQNLSVQLSSVELTGTSTCTVEATVTANPAAQAGDYRVSVDVGYVTLDADGSQLNSGVAGSIKVTVS